MSRKKRGGQKTIELAALLTASQLLQAGTITAQAQEEYSGVTQMASKEVCLDVTDLAVALEVEEICVSAGDSVREGDTILKLTAESYEKAVAYYAAAVLRAENDLTDTQLEYDQGVLAAKYTCEAAQAEAENAETVKEYQTKEVEDALAEHANVLEKLADRIDALKEGIADGSYETGSSSSSSGATGSGSAGGGGSSSFGKMPGSGSESESRSENGQSENGESESGGQSESGESESSGQSESSESESSGQPESGESESNGQSESSESESNVQPGSGGQETGGTTDGGGQSEPATDSDASVEAQKRELAETLEKMETLGASIAESLKQQTDGPETGENDNQSDYDTYAAQLDNLITELKADIQEQEQAKKLLQEDEKDALEASIAGNTRVLESLKDIQTRLQKYQKVIRTMLGILDTGTDTVLVDAKTLEDMNDYMELQENCSRLYAELLAAYEKELSDRTDTPNETLPDGSGSSDSGTQQPGSESNGSGNQQSGSGSSDSGTRQPGSESSGSGVQQPGNESNGSGDQQPESGSDGFRSGTQESEGTSGQNTAGAAGSMPLGSTGGSLPSGAAGTGAGTVSSDAAVVQTGQDGNTAAEGFETSSADISILGNAYDLTKVKSMLEQEPADTDAAEELLEQLTDAQEDVETQYEELQRMEAIYRLKIQYTYDTTNLAAQLAEVTYEQELQEWENTLSEAKEEKETLEKQKAVLDAMEDGTICADQSGIVSAVSYEAGDTVSSTVPIVSYYDTDTVTVTLEIPQEEIAGIAVGQTAEVQLNGQWTVEGTVSGKTLEPESGTSRTNIVYSAEVSIKNESGRISAGTAATVTFPDTEGAGGEE